MNRTMKRCLLGLVASTTMFGIAWGQSDEPVGTVQLGPNAQASPPAPMGVAPQDSGPSDYQPTQGSQPIFGDPQSPGMLPSAPYISAPAGSAPVPGQPGPGFYNLTPVDQVMTTRFNVDSRGGGLYGYGAGYSNIGAFVPYKIDNNSLFFGTGQALLTYDSRGGATVGGGYRHYMEEIDRILGLAAFVDFDNGHAKPYQQLGFSFESLGRYTDFRVNGYAPIGNSTHVLSATPTAVTSVNGSSIFLNQINQIEQSYGGFDAETGGPTPFLGRYGLNAYIGGYYLMSSGVLGGNTTGVSGRLQSQINEDVSFGVQVTNDHLFGLNTQFQVFMNLPNGRPGRWMRNLQVRDHLVQNVFRQNRVLAKEFTYTSQVAAIDPNTHKPYFVAFIDPNASTNGNGTSASPFNSIAGYEAQSVAQQKQYDLILVKPGTATTNVNLNTNTLFGSTLNIYNNQRLLSTSAQATIFTENLPGVSIPVPGLSAGNSPLLTNSGGNNVVTLIGGNTQTEQVSGFQIVGSGTGNGIFGVNNTAVTIDHNTIGSSANGIFLQNLSGTIAAGTQANLLNNTLQTNFGNGIWINNTTANTLETKVLGNKFSSNGADGLRMDALAAGGSIGGVIGGTNTAATATSAAVNQSNTFSGNGTNGLDLRANGGNLNFNTPASGFAIFNNNFTTNGNNGLNISTAGGSNSGFNIISNTFGNASDATQGNKNFGIGLATSSGNTTLLIGGAKSNNANGTVNNPGNMFYNNGTNAVDISASGTAALSYNINNNTVTNTFVTNAPPPVDQFTFTINTASSTGGIPGDTFTLTDTSTATRGLPASITGMNWNLANSAAVFNQLALSVTTSVAVQPPSGDGLLTSVNGINVVTGSNPLTLTGGGALAANDGNLGLPSFGQNLPLGFNKNAFVTGAVFTANTGLVQGDHLTAATAQNLLGSSVTVSFNDGRTATAKLAALTGSTTVDTASASVNGPLSPGYGSGNDGIHVATSGSASTSTALIQNNTIEGVGGFGINVANGGSTSTNKVSILNNTLEFDGTGVNAAGIATFTGGGINVSQMGTTSTASFNALIQGNIAQQNFNNGITVMAEGTGTMFVTSSGNFVNDPSTNANSPEGNAANGLCIVTSGTTNLTFNSTGENFSGNGIGSGLNPALTGGDNVAVVTNDSSIANVNLNSVTSEKASANGLSATSNNGSTLNLNIASSLFENNGANGIHLTGNDQSLFNFNLTNSTLTNNVSNGILFNRNGASLFQANITNTTMSTNGASGLSWLGIGSNETDPTQQMSGTSNMVNLYGDTLNNNGTGGNGDGATIKAFGQSSIVLNAYTYNPTPTTVKRTTFDNNVGNGVSVDETPGAQFGDPSTNTRSKFDGVDLSGNGLNGIVFASEISGNPIGDVASRTYFQLTSVGAVTTVQNNGTNGIATEYQGGHLVDANGNYAIAHDILVQGNATNGLYIQSNGGDGIHADIGNFADLNMTVDTVTIGGTALTAGGLPGKSEPAGNQGNGIWFSVQMSTALSQNIQSIDEHAGLYTYVQAYERAGAGTLNVNNSIITNNTLNGIELYGNGLVNNNAANGLSPFANPGARTYNTFTDGYGNINANVTNNTIANNGKDGVDIEILGKMGSDRYPFSNTGFYAIQQYNASGPTGIYNTLNFTNNTIVNNGNYGMFIQQNAAKQYFNTFVIFLYDNFDPTSPPQNFPIQPFDPENTFGATYAYNNVTQLGTGTNGIGGVLDAINMSNWLSLETAQSTILNVNNNTIQGNGQNHDLSHADGIKIREGTDSYLAANLQGNNLTGNVGSSLYVESFTQYDPTTNISIPIPFTAVHGSPASGTTPGKPDEVVLDYTAQLYMNLANNTGDSVNIVNPGVNFSATLPGNISGNGAYYTEDPQKNYPFSTASGGVNRLVQLFEINNGANLNTTNSFFSNGIAQNLQNAFYHGDFYLEPSNNTSFPGLAFPEDYAANPGNPFVP